MNYMEELQEAYEKNLLIPVIGSGLSAPLVFQHGETL